MSGGPHTYSGATIVSGGTMVNSSIGGSPANTATLTVGNFAAAPAILRIVPGANITNYNIGIGNGAYGAVFQSGGTFNQIQVRTSRISALATALVAMAIINSPAEC